MPSNVFQNFPESYASWRQAALAAHNIFKPYNGSLRHYQAVIILRSKVRGPADAVKALFAIVLVSRRPAFAAILRYYSSISKFIQPTQFPVVTNNHTNSNQKQQRVNHVTKWFSRQCRPQSSGVGWRWCWLRYAQFIREKSLLPVIRRKVAGINMKILMYTGASKNFTRPYKVLRDVRPSDFPFFFRLLHIWWESRPWFVDTSWRVDLPSFGKLK